MDEMQKYFWFPHQATHCYSLLLLPGTLSQVVGKDAVNLNSRHMSSICVYLPVHLLFLAQATANKRQGPFYNVVIAKTKQNREMETLIMTYALPVY